VTGRDAVLLVARREIVERARDRSFLISTGIVLVMIALFTLGPRLLGLGGPDDYTVGTVGAGSEALAGAVAERAPAADAEVTLEGLADDEAARAAVRDGDVDVAILDGERLLVDSELPGGLEALLQESSEQLRVSERLTEAGVPAQDVGAVLAPEPLAVEALNPPEDRGDRDAASGLAFFTVFILYGQLFGYGMWVAMGVVEEKSTRVVEVLLATISPTHLLAGKVIGIGLLGLAQLTLIATLGVGIVLLTGATQLPPSAPAAIATALGWYVLGYAFYACVRDVRGAGVPPGGAPERHHPAHPVDLRLVVPRLRRAERPGRHGRANRVVRASGRPDGHARARHARRGGRLGGRCIGRGHARLDRRHGAPGRPRVPGRDPADRGARQDPGRPAGAVSPADCYRARSEQAAASAPGAA